MAAAPFVHLPRSNNLTGEDALRRAVFDGDLGRTRIKGLVKSIIKENGDPGTIFSSSKDSPSVLYLAAYQGHLEVCKYLVEELGGDVNAPAVGAACRGSTPFMASCHSGDVPTVRYFLDHGGDLMKPDLQGLTVPHHAVGAGCYKITEFLLSKGIPVDIDYGQGTPLYVAATNE